MKLEFYDKTTEVKSVVVPIVDVKRKGLFKTYYQIRTYCYYATGWVNVFSPVTATIYSDIEVAKEQAQIVVDNYWSDCPF